MFFDQFLKLCSRDGISPAVAAVNMGFHRSVTSRWNHTTTPRKATVQRIADYFEVEPDFFFGADPAPAKKEKPVLENEDELSEVKKAALEWLLSKDDETIKRFIDGAKTMMGE